ncbi:hypothetical protein GCK72_018063 [Caenorhabditis remanei]|uniref:Uncharacterized protein n=1 Tax=Caenorhabditis remanei TaxID=31234 RepID=A0A6A5GAJ5_CAERE|nr:hypothetical protein GCK72_018063 [Caenorhabditis remanei]KAF1751509.1 hypothetical protein GCK72_018063 [Caenorhabditis remanei]
MGKKRKKKGIWTNLRAETNEAMIFRIKPKGWTGARRGTADVLVSGDSLRAQRNENLSLNMSMMNLERVA